jgi:3-oxoacyl-[acyl-carrier-protein] synthase-1
LTVTAPEGVVIVGLGMTTAVGLSAKETAASERAGTMRVGESPLYDRRYNPFTLALVPNDGLPKLARPLRRLPVTNRESRLLRLATQPLRECAGTLPRGGPRPPLLLVLPEPNPARPADPVGFLALLSRQVGDVFDATRSEAHCLGRAGGVLALGRAAEWIRADLAPFVLVGGVDTFRDLQVLASLDAEGRVKSEANLDGFIPGEGAGFLALTSRRAAAAWGLDVLAVLSPVAHGIEPGHLYSEQPYRGAGLAAAVQAATATAQAGAVRTVYCTMNGESHWAKEWGVALLRSRPAFADDHVVHHPAEYFGDIGAAAGPVMIGLAALGIRGGYRGGPCLVYASSDRETRAAVIVAGAAGTH